MAKHRRKWKKVNVEGLEVTILIDEQSNDGPFFCEHGHTTYSGRTVDELVGKLRNDIKAGMAVEYRPIIIIQNQSVQRMPWGRPDIFGIKITRIFRGQHPYKGDVYRVFANPQDSVFTADKRSLEGVPGKDCPCAEIKKEAVTIIEYTPQRWARLLHIQDEYAKLKQHIENALSSEDTHYYLDRGNVELIAQYDENQKEHHK